MNPFISNIPDGDQVGFSSAPEITQGFGVTMANGSTYEIKVWVGGRCGALSGRTYTAALTANGTSVGGGGETSSTNAEGWAELTPTHVAGAGDDGKELGVYRANESNAGQVNWDHVRISIDGNGDGCVAVP